MKKGVADPQELFDEFVDYWRALPGKDGRKLDWEATWRNRCRVVGARDRKAAKLGAAGARRHPHAPPDTGDPTRTYGDYSPLAKRLLEEDLAEEAERKREAEAKKAVEPVLEEL